MSRANYIIVEESRLVPKEILERVIKPFLFSRMPPYRLKPEYANDDLLKEEGIISYITSAWYSSEYWFTYVKSCIKRMVNGDKTANFLAFDYLISVYHNIKTEAMIKNEMTDNDDVSVQMEYFNIPSSTSNKAYFKTSMFSRNIKRAFYPQKEDTFDSKKNPYAIPKVEGEIRFVSVDVAMRSGKKNDQTIISCVKCIPMIGKGMERTLLYMESHKGEHTGVQAEKIKELFFDFDANYIVLDLQNAGIGIFDSLSQVTPCDERGVIFPPLTVVGKTFDFVDEKLIDELEKRTLGLNATPCIFPIRGTPGLNSEIAVFFRSSLQKKLWNFLIPDGDAEIFLTKYQKEFIKNSNDAYAYGFFMNPYVQTSLFITESVSLDTILNMGVIKLVERPGNYKDRYSSVSYANWVISHFDYDLLKENAEEDNLSIFESMTMVF